MQHKEVIEYFNFDYIQTYRREQVFGVQPQSAWALF